ncbi:MAG: class I SAM-dependent methyltransferase family protein [Candidatus Aenigmatarchaeota archaeon]
MPGFDIIGSKEKAVAIVEIPEGVDEKEIAKEIMTKNKNVKSVLKKMSKRKGEYRLWELKLIAGEKNTEVVHKEYGYFLRLDPKKVYFSPREATERQRIASQVKENEIVMLFFAGIGAQAVAIAKKQPKVKKIIGIEINPDAFYYMEENIRINKISHLVLPVLGDVKEKAKDFFKICDRVIMPLPLEAEKFLDSALNCLKEKGIIHFYSIDSEDFNETIKKISKKIKNFKIIKKNIVLPYAPRKFKVCIDFEVEK